MHGRETLQTCLSKMTVSPDNYNKFLNSPVKRKFLPNTICRPLRHSYVPSATVKNGQPGPPFFGFPDPLDFLNGLREPQALSQGYQLEGCWVLKPEGKRKGVIHFLGGAFVGASPQVAYALLIEELANEGYVVISTPYDLTFNHAACALKAAQSLDRCLTQLCILPTAMSPRPNSSLTADETAFQSLPLFTLGHSNGALLHLLASSLPECQNTAYAHVQSTVLMSFNNKNVSEAVPGGVPDGVSPVAAQLMQMQSSLAPQISSFFPPPPDLAKPFLPFLDQINPAVQELAKGAQEFVPTPDQSRAIIKEGYTIPRTLLIQFNDDSFDETPEMNTILLETAGVEIVQVEEIRGLGHLTPLGATVDWDASETFNPLDAIGQALKQDVIRRIRGLSNKITPWYEG